MAEKPEKGDDRVRPAAWHGRRIEFAHQGAIFQHPVVIDPHRDEHEVSLPLGVERRDQVAEEAEPGRAEMPVAGQAALGVERLYDPALCRHLHVARQHAAVERIIGCPPHEEPAERFNQGLQGPGPRPFAHRIAQGGAIRGQVGDDEVIRIAAVIHHKHDARVGRDAGQRGVVGIAEADAIEQLQQAPGEGIAKAEIDVDVERRDNLTRIALDLAQQGRSRLLGLLRLGLDRLHDRGVVRQAIDQHLAFCPLEKRDLQGEAGIELVDHTTGAPAEKPSGAGHKQAVEHRPKDKGTGNRHDPGWKGDRLCHFRARQAVVKATRGSDFTCQSADYPGWRFRRVSRDQEQDLTQVCGPLLLKGVLHSQNCPRPLPYNHQDA